MRILKIKEVSLLIAVIVLLAVISSCSRVFEDDLEEEVIQFISPLNGQILSTGEITISWEEVNDAISYEVRIVSPDFNVDSPTIIFDGTVAEPSTTHELEDGDYAISVYAINSSSETEASFIEFTVFESGLFSGQQVEVTSPSEGEFFDSEEVLIEWDEIDEAVDYTLRVYENDNGSEGDEVFSEVSTELEFEYTFTEGEYFLTIIAYDGTDLTVDNTIAFGVDLTAPTLPVLNSPNTQIFLSSEEITFVWSSGEDTLSETTDSIFIYSQTTDELVFSELVNSPYDLPSETLTSDNYEWGIVTTDEAGNWAESDYNLVVVNE